MPVAENIVRRAENRLTHITHDREGQSRAEAGPDSALEQVCLDFNFLLGGEVNFRVEGFVSGQADGDFAMSGGDDQALASPAQLGSMAHELSIQKDSRAIRIYSHFDLGGYGRHYEASVFDHLHGHDLLLSGMQHYVPPEVQVAVLSDRDFVLARKQENLL